MNRKLYYVDKIRLVGKIKGLSNEVKRARFDILNSKKIIRVSRAAYLKHCIGLDTRHHLLAYAFLKGKNYSQIEKSCRPDNKPNIASIVDIIKNNVYLCNISEDLITDWLKK